jgi:alkanesulfonate monooxygenase SsuD/methylene tetrahydromethanopterin reductase-like flavin-dependent oxidoreductase (luciferase family)
MQEQRRKLRERIYAEQGIRMVEEVVPPARVQVEHALITGSPATVAEKMAEIDATGVGGVICAFRLGPMPAEVARNSIELFMTKVAPQFQAPSEAAARLAAAE